MKTIEFTKEEIEKLKKLILGLNVYYEEKNNPDDENFESWSFEDVDAQREIACEFVNILADKLDIKSNISTSYKHLNSYTKSIF